MFYHRNGKPYPDDHAGLMEWAKDFENHDLKRVAETTLPDGTWISTVWLGLDHNYMSGGVPLIFETMVFSKKLPGNFEGLGTGVGLERDQERYSTEAQALAGHARMVAKWSKKEAKP